MKTYNTYQAQNAVKAAQVTNHIIARKKEGVTHEDAKAEAYYIYNIKEGKKLLVKNFKYGR
tara:strand:- start:1602 stop:1784 length:183 start_codon:yes stop_codon:yes gene_type:complete